MIHACCAHRCRNERKAVARRLPCFDSVPSIDLRIRSRVTGLSSEVAYVPGDFLDLGSCPATDLALRRMVKDGTLRRLVSMIVVKRTWRWVYWHAYSAECSSESRIFVNRFDIILAPGNICKPLRRNKEIFERKIRRQRNDIVSPSIS